MRGDCTGTHVDRGKFSVLRFAPKAFSVALSGSNCSSPSLRTEERLACVGVCNDSALRGVRGEEGDIRMDVSSCILALRLPRHPIRFRMGEGEVGDLLRHVDERLRRRVRRGKRGEEGVGDLLVSMTVRVVEGDCGMAVGERRGEAVESDMAARRRATEVEDWVEVMDVVDDRERRGGIGGAFGKVLLATRSLWSRIGAWKSEALGVSVSSSSLKQEPRVRLPELIFSPEDLLAV